MTTKEFAQMVYDSWNLTAQQFHEKYNLKPGDIMEEVVIEEALRQGAEE